MTEAYADAPRQYARITRRDAARHANGHSAAAFPCSSASWNPSGPLSGGGVAGTGRSRASAGGLAGPPAAPRVDINRRTERRYQRSASHASSAASMTDTTNT